MNPEVLEREFRRTGDRAVLGEARVGLLRAVGLALHARAVAERDVVHRIADAAAGAAGADGEHDARAVAGADEDVFRPRRAVHEAPRAQEPLLALDQQEALARQDEEVLLRVLPVVEPVRLARMKDADADPDLLEVLAGRLVRHVRAAAVVLE